MDTGPIVKLYKRVFCVVLFLADSGQWLSRWRSKQAPHIYELCAVKKKKASGCPATEARLPVGAVPLYRRAQSPPPPPLLGGKGGQRGATKEICVLYNDISRPKQADGTLSKKLYQDVAYRLTIQLRLNRTTLNKGL